MSLFRKKDQNSTKYIYLIVYSNIKGCNKNEVRLSLEKRFRATIKHCMEECNLKIVP